MSGRRQAVTVSLEMGNLRLQMRPKPLMGAVARAMATQTRRMLRRGQKTGGGAVRRGQDGGRPLRDTGSLLRSMKGKAVRSRRPRGWAAAVWAQGTRDDLGESLRGRQGALLGVLIHGRRNDRHRPRNPGLMQAGPEVRRAAMEAFEKALQKQLDRGQARITGGAAGRTRLPSVEEMERYLG